MLKGQSPEKVEEIMIMWRTVVPTNFKNVLPNQPKSGSGVVTWWGDDNDSFGGSAHFFDMYAVWCSRILKRYKKIIKYIKTFTFFISILLSF
jgi:hypothetical protein